MNTKQIEKSKNNLKWGPFVLIGIGLLLGLIFREPILAWFSGDSENSETKLSASSHSHGSNLKEHSEKHPGEKIAYYTCSMHPSVKSHKPGQCPICSMDLTPVSQESIDSGDIIVSKIRRQKIGVRTEKIEERVLSKKIEALGKVKYDETRLSDVNLRMDGWVEKLFVEETGQKVRKGQVLFTLYSPELYAAQLEFLSTIGRNKNNASAVAFADLQKAARQRLRLLGMRKEQIENLVRKNKAVENLPILAPASGFIIEKHIVEGAKVKSGSLVYRIADLRKVWIDAEIYESDLGIVNVGQSAQVSFPYSQNEKIHGKIDFIYPTIQDSTRTGRARIVLSNRDLNLKPDMYANVQIKVNIGARLAIPGSSVIFTGTRRLVFVDLGEGRLQARIVKLGMRLGAYYEVIEGLKSGDSIVTSGNFLIAAESRLSSAVKYWEAEDASE